MLPPKFTVTRVTAVMVVLLSVFLGPDFIRAIQNAVLMTTPAI